LKITKKSRYIRTGLTFVYEIWHSDAWGKACNMDHIKINANSVGVSQDILRSKFKYITLYGPALKLANLQCMTITKTLHWLFLNTVKWSILHTSQCKMDHLVHITPVNKSRQRTHQCNDQCNFNLVPIRSRRVT